MKKIAILIALMVTPLVTNAQSFFDTLENMDGVDMVVVTKDAFELISKFKNISTNDNEGLKVFQMIKELKEFKMFSTKDAGIANEMDGMFKKVIKKKRLTELMRIKEDKSRIKIYVQSTKNKDFVSEVLMLIKGLDKKTQGYSEALVVSLTGNIDINKMSKIADTFASGNTK
jgi:hypothetical protein